MSGDSQERMLQRVRMLPSHVVWAEAQKQGCRDRGVVEESRTRTPTRTRRYDGACRRQATGDRRFGLEKLRRGNFKTRWHLTYSNIRPARRIALHALRLTSRWAHRRPAAAQVSPRVAPALPARAPSAPGSPHDASCHHWQW